MSRRAGNILLLLVLVGGLAFSWTAARNATRPNAEFLPDMAHSPAYGAYAPNLNFRDGKTLQPPAAGTIAREHQPLHYAASTQDALRAGQELVNPFSAADPQATARGATVFATFCQHCHGPGGLGDGPVARRGFPPPPSLVAQHALDMQDGQMFHAITYGQGNMPSHAAQVSSTDRWKVIAYIRTLPGRAASTQSAATQPAGAARP